MPFVKIKGLQGKVYVPEKNIINQPKNPCKDCFSCQQCGDDRCEVCLRQRSCIKSHIQKVERKKHA